MTKEEKIRAEVPARITARDAMPPIGSVPRPLRNDARPARDPFEIPDNRIPRDASRLSWRT